MADSSKEYGKQQNDSSDEESKEKISVNIIKTQTARLEKQKQFEIRN